MHIDNQILKNVVALVAPIIAVLAVFGYVYTFGRELEGIHDRIDRNCRFLAIVEADTQFLIVEHASSRVQAKDFQEIYKNAIRDTCG